MKKMNKKGFTLMEMLIVVAIIAVLVAIMIPVFGNQLEAAREAVDAANLRAAYAEIMANHLLDSGPASIEVFQKQKRADWQTTFDFPENFSVQGPTAAGKWTVQWSDAAFDNTGGVTAVHTSS